MDFKDLFAKIYITYGKKYFQDGQELLECVRKVDPDIPVRQFTVIDYLTRQNNFEKLMAVRFESEPQQEIVINQIASAMQADYFVPEKETRDCAQAFLAVFQHGSRSRMSRLEQEYDESLAPTMAMEPIDVTKLDQAPLLDEIDYTQEEEEDDDNLQDTSQEYSQDVLMTQRVFAPADLKDLEETDGDQEVDPDVQPAKMKKVNRKAKKMPAVQSEESTKKAGKASTIILIILFILLIICVGFLFFVLKDMGMI